MSKHDRMAWVWGPVVPDSDAQLVLEALAGSAREASGPLGLRPVATKDLARATGLSESVVVELVRALARIGIIALVVQERPGLAVVDDQDRGD